MVLAIIPMDLSYKGMKDYVNAFFKEFVHMVAHESASLVSLLFYFAGFQAIL